MERTEAKKEKNLGKDSAVYEKREEIIKFEQRAIEIDVNEMQNVSEENESKEAKIIEKMEERKKREKFWPKKNKEQRKAKKLKNEENEKRIMGSIQQIKH